MNRLLFFLSSILLASCSYDNIEIASHHTAPDTTTTPADTSWVASFDTRLLSVNNGFDSASSIGPLGDPSLNEVSGIAASYGMPGALWVEEDSGNPSVISLLGSDGKYLGSMSLNKITDRDWEDMSSAPGPTDGLHYIYLADIGDNDKKYPTKYIYRFPEPPVSLGTTPFQNSISTFDIISFSFPDGVKNAEAVMVDPSTKDIYVISKESDKAGVYIASYPQPIGKNFVLTKVGTLPFIKVTAADISPDGTEIVIKNYTQIYYWKRSLNQSISSVIRKAPLLLPYVPEPQGESFCFAADASGFYTTSEMTDSNMPPVYFYKRK